eukprot:TRINITY_DN706_c0_g1_i3.p1 TRINITY_DN706_c0_g1~~TRINITY_DN706_c0_g1_i3.p1  ORF type:complete len:318 (-),score=89.33 TRINITY_DN706_c0_g1_i3:121-1074(-)
MVQRLREILAKNTTDSIPAAKDLVVVNVHDTPLQGFEKLLEHKIQSAPVFDSASGKYTGFLDVRDLISFCVYLHGSNERAENLLDIVSFGVKMFKHSVEGVTVAYLSKRNPFHAIKQGITLLEAVEFLTKNNLRRVPVVNEKGDIVNIISQSSIVQFLGQHMMELRDEFTAHIGDVPVGSSPVLSAKRDEKAIDVFKTMDSHHRSGVAVVDDRGALVGNTSGHDLKLFIKNPSVSVLNLPILTFLNQIRQLQIDIVNPAISSGVNDSFGHVIGKVAATRIHRIFIVDADNRPVKVVSLTDILSYVATQTASAAPEAK